MMKKLVSALLMLCLLVSMTSGALAAYDATKPACRNPEHEKWDGQNHNRPQSCWITGHFECDGADHTRAACGVWGHFNCDGKEHVAASCGAEDHFACKGTHAQAKCGLANHCVNDGKRHTAAICGKEGHLACDGMKHSSASCGKRGHLGCDGLDHTQAACGVWGHFNCDGKEHAPAPCGKRGHCIADGKNHGMGECGYAGHIGCVGDHGIAKCGIEGHFACEGGHTTAVMSKYCIAEPQHKKCEKTAEHFCDPEIGGCGVTYLCEDSSKHTTCSKCGLLWCDGSLGGHYTPCGNANHRPCVYTLAGKTWRASDHPKCDLCGGGKCSGRHGAGVCVPVCSSCGEPLKNWKSHRAKCGEHFKCRPSSAGLDHDWCSLCGMPKCRGEHGAVHAKNESASK